VRFSSEGLCRWQLHRQGQFLEQAEQFQHDYDHNNYADYVEDASVHAEDGYQTVCAVTSILCKLAASVPGIANPMASLGKCIHC
jgi:hypothetical protein